MDIYMTGWNQKHTFASGRVFQGGNIFYKLLSDINHHFEAFVTHLDIGVYPDICSLFGQGKLNS